MQIRVSDNATYQNNNKTRCRNNVFYSIYKSGRTDDEAISELAFFEQQYSDLKIKDYIIKMRDLSLSYVVNENLKPSERIAYVEGMGFAYDCIGKIRQINNYMVLNDEVQLDFIKDELSKKMEEKSIELTDEEEELFKLGILASCAINFCIIDRENIISKKLVK